LTAERTNDDRPRVVTIEQNPSRLRVEEPHEQIRECALPAPLGPTIAITSPGRTSKLTLCTAGAEAS
jgi:hypothetical protein